MCVIYIHVFKTYTFFSVTRHKIETKLPFRNNSVFILMVLSIEFNFIAHML